MEEKRMNIKMALLGGIDIEQMYLLFFSSCWPGFDLRPCYLTVVGS